MRDLSSISAETILRARTSEQLFTGSLPQAKIEYRLLARRWHPDCTCESIAPAVFSHVVSLYRSALTKLNDGTWQEPIEKIEQETVGLKKFKVLGGGLKVHECVSARPFELGTMFIGHHSVAFEVGKEYDDLFRNGRKCMRACQFQSRDMAAEFSQSLPQILDQFQTGNASVLVVRKTPDQLLLTDVLKYLGGRLPSPEHCGWILNALLNVLCYLEWAGLTHNGITTDTVFVSPRRHSCMLLGGWWYSARAASRLLALPEAACQDIDLDTVRSGRADSRLDLDLVRAIGRTLLGDRSGNRLVLDQSLPQKLVSWLRESSHGSARTNYRQWKNEVLKDSFGEPRFVELKVESADLYKEV